MNLNELRAQQAMERNVEVKKEQFGNISHSGYEPKYVRK